MPRIQQPIPGGTVSAWPTLAGRTAQWALVAGVTGCLANALLAALYADLLLDPAAQGRLAWTGPANDFVGAVSTAATIPVVLGMRTLEGRTRRVRVLALLLPLAAVALILASALLLMGDIKLSTQVVAALPYTGLLFAWCLALGEAGRASPQGRRLTSGVVAIGAAGCSGLGLAALALSFPPGSVPQVALGVPAIILGAGAYLAFPIWQIRLSSRLTNQAFFAEPLTPS